MDEDTPCAALSDEALLAALERRELAAGAFGHAEHVRAAWAYLQRGSFLAALGRFMAALRGFAAHHGAAERVHATITGAFMALIHERALRLPAGHSFAAFRAAYPELFADGAALVGRYYRAETLASAAARAAFVAPDLDMLEETCPQGHVTRGRSAAAAYEGARRAPLAAAEVGATLVDEATAPAARTSEVEIRR